jgi:hypothetical protein
VFVWCVFSIGVGADEKNPTLTDLSIALAQYYSDQLIDKNIRCVSISLSGVKKKAISKVDNNSTMVRTITDIVVHLNNDPNLKDLNETQKMTIVVYIYFKGGTVFQQSKLYKYIKNGQLESVADEFDHDESRRFWKASLKKT